MRRFLISLLLASAAAATPALAEPNDGRPNFGSEQQDAHAEARAQRQQAREERAQAREQAQFSQPSQPSESHGSANDHASQVRSFDGGGAHFGGVQMERSSNPDIPESVRGWRSQRAESDPPADAHGSDMHGSQHAPRGPTNWRRHERQAGDEAGSGGRDNASTDSGGEIPTAGGRTIQWRRVPAGGSGGLGQPGRPLPRVLRTRTPVVSDTPREGTQPPPRTETFRRTSVAHWDTSWRHNGRYNWWDWRRRHHSFFHLGFYYDPFGWDYRPYSIGWRLWPIYYSSRYWITDPWQYRLPYAPPGYRWIRYYDDLLLVDTWDGEVVDVIHNFFW